MELLGERYELALERIKEIPGEHFGVPALEDYFTAVSLFLVKMGRTWDYVAGGRMKTASLEELKDHNHSLYEDILEENYAKSYVNPAFSTEKLGEELGPLLSFLYYEMRSLIVFAYEQRLEDMVIRLELFVEVYAAFVYEWQENKRLPEYETVRDILYWFASDYADVAARQKVETLVVTEGNFAVDILKNADLSDVRYLYQYGEYVTDCEIETARFLAGLPQETIDLMADTYTEGYRKGFILGGKDLSRKTTVEVRFPLGFERMIRKAVRNFENMGLKPSVCRAPVSILHDPGLVKNGYFGANPNRQYDFDHREDRALFLDKAYVNRRLEVMRTAWEMYKEEARGYAGPAVVETFGEEEFEPLNRAESIRLTPQQQSLWVEWRMGAGQIMREYILEEERSFTIIAFPVPKIGKDFPEIFKEIIRINTLDYQLYRDIQQTIIDTLNRAVYCEIRGSGANRTCLKVRLHELADPEKETIFENCVADVNIPVGEVFTSPVLLGTQGVLHVGRVFLNGLEYRDLAITFEDGMITDYTCGNFEKEEENRAFIKENILFHNDTLPMGEFAIGTNTTAYVTALKYDIGAKLPILIAEKMGPHFAVGDTCYSHCEDIAVYNPDGREIVARDNEVSILRRTNPKKAYFNCHTDITIPYDELGELAAVGGDGRRTLIIKDGRFVLPGTEALNEPFGDR